MPGLISVRAGAYRPPLPNGVPNISRQVGRTSNNTLSIATTSNLPTGASYGTSTGVGRIIFTQSVADWDFRGIDAHYLINAAGITISQCLFDLSNYTVSNLAFLYTQGASIYWNLQNCTIDGKNNTSVVTRCIGSDNSSGAPDLVDSNQIINWPLDWISGIVGVTGRTTTISNNFVSCSSSAISALHTDGIQVVLWNEILVINNNVIDITPIAGAGSTQTSPLNLGRSVSFANSITAQNNILIGPATGFSIITGNAGGSPTGNITVTNNYFTGDGFGILNSNSQADPILVMNNCYNSNTGAARSFVYNDGSSNHTVFSWP